MKYFALIASFWMWSISVDAPHVIEKQIEVKDGQVVEQNFQMPVRDVKVNQKKMSRQVAGH